MHDDFYQMYLEELEEITPCTQTETLTLAAALRDGEQAAAKRLIEGKLAQVLEIAREFADQGVLMGDLVQEANVILTGFAGSFAGAPELFDQQLNAIVREGLAQVVDVQKNEEQIEETVLARLNVLQDISKMMAEELGREATVEELAEKMKMTGEEIRDIMKLALDALHVSAEA